MRVVIVNRDAPTSIGVVVNKDWSHRGQVSRDATEVAKALSAALLSEESLQAIRDELFDRGLIEHRLPPEANVSVADVAKFMAGAFLPGAGGLVLAHSNRLLDRFGLRDTHETAYRLGFARGYRASATEDERYRAVSQPSFALGAVPSDGDCLDRNSITHLGRAFGPNSAFPTESLLFGNLRDDKQRLAVLAADGGYSKIHVVRLDRARAVLKRHGEGIIEEGLYLLHPKREDVLVPFKTYHADMLAEMTREARVVLGRIGAKMLTIETVEGVTFGGEVVSKVPLKSGSAKAQYESESNRRVVYEWGSPTFEPERALADCVWIQDNGGVMTIVDQRRTSNLTKYEEFSRIDTSFRMNLEIMKLFAANFDWAETSTYRYDVQFFDKSRV